MSNSTDRFIQELIDGGLVSASEVRDVIEAAPAAARPADAKVVTERLVAHGKLTEYQAAAIREGRLDELVIGNYVVLDRLGAGGMGTVYRALHRRMKRVVALKLLSPAVSQNTAFVQRFQREIEAIARLNHTNIVIAYDADQSEAGHYLVMEFVDGSDLATVVEQRGPLPLPEAVDGIVQAARALEYVHAQGVVHRDIKPANLLRDRGGTVKVADLGLARFTDPLGGTAGGGSLTQDGSIAGTVDFMAPEQALNTRLADHRADIYSLGCSLYFLLTGQLTYTGETVMEKLLGHREAPIPSLCAVRRAVPQQLDAVVQRMLAKKPADRYQSMSEVIRDLLACGIEAVDEPSFEVGPSSSPVAEVAATTDESAPVTVADMVVQLTEPSRMQSRVITGYLQKLGIQHVRPSTSAEQAIEAMLQSAAHLVIAAMHLPDMTGLDLLRQVRADRRLRSTAFILISSEADIPRLDSSSGNSRVAILPKPFDIDLLRWAISVATDMTLSDVPVLPQCRMDHANVLIVDDSVVARQRVRAVLADLGVRQIVEATNGREACQLLDERPFDVVVSDYNMPEMDGQELLRYIRQHRSHRSIPVLMVTSESDTGKLAAVQHLGVSALCDKDFEPAMIRDVLTRVLSERRTGSNP